MSSARVARRAAARRSFSLSTMGSGEAGRATGGDLTGTGFGAAGAGAGAGAATTVGFFAERCAADGDFGAGAGTGAGTGFFTARRAVRPVTTHSTCYKQESMHHGRIMCTTIP